MANRRFSLKRLSSFQEERLARKKYRTVCREYSGTRRSKSPASGAGKALSHCGLRNAEWKSQKDDSQAESVRVVQEGWSPRRRSALRADARRPARGRDV